MSNPRARPLELVDLFPYQWIIPDNGMILNRDGSLTDLFYVESAAVEDVVGGRLEDLLTAGRRFIKQLNSTLSVFVDFRLIRTTDFGDEKRRYWQDVDRDPNRPSYRFCEEKWRFIDQLAQRELSSKQVVVASVTYVMDVDDLRVLKDVRKRTDIGKARQLVDQALERACVQFASRFESFREHFAGMGFALHPIDEASKYQILFSFLNDQHCAFEGLSEPRRVLARSLYRTDWTLRDAGGELLGDHIQVGSECRGVLSLYQKPFYLDGIQGMVFRDKVLRDCEVVFKFFPWQRSRAKKEVGLAMAHFADLPNQTKSARLIKEHQHIGSELNDLTDQLQRGDVEMSRMGVYILVKSDSPEGLRERMRSIQQFFADRYQDCEFMVNRDADLLHALSVCAPGIFWENNLSPLGDGGAQLCLPTDALPWVDINAIKFMPYGGSFSHGGKDLVAMIGRERQPVTLDNRGRGAGHGVVVGPTGSGKSVILNMLISQSASLRDSFMCIWDVDKSFRRTVDVLGGHEVKVDTGDPKCTLNPFHLPEGVFYDGALTDGSERTDTRAIADWFRVALADDESSSIIKAVYGSLSKMIKAFLVECNRQLREGERVWRVDPQMPEMPALPTISEFIAYLDAQKVPPELVDCRNTLNLFVRESSVYNLLFDGQTAVDFSQSVLVFDFYDVRNEADLIALYGLQILNHTASVFYARGQRASVVVDESHFFFNSKRFRRSIASEITRVGRKQNLDVIFASQNFVDFTKWEDLPQFFVNINFLLLARSEEVKEIAATKEWSDSEINMYRNLGQPGPYVREWMFWRNQDSYREYGVVVPFLSPFEYWCFTTEPSEVAFIEALSEVASAEWGVTERDLVFYVVTVLTSYFNGDPERIGDDDYLGFARSGTVTFSSVLDDPAFLEACVGALPSEDLAPQVRKWFEKEVTLVGEVV